MLRLLSAFVTLSAVLCFNNDQNKVVYGTDNRKDFYDVSDEVKYLTRNSTVALMKTATLGNLVNGIYCGHQSASTLKEAMMLCPGEKFSSQPTAAFCSGTLIGRDRVLTAGHCVSDYEEMSLVFDYYMEDNDGGMGQISADDVYTARRVYHRLESTYYPEDFKWDYAVIQLDRPVRGRTPATVKSAATLEGNRIHQYDKVTMFGYPSGLPFKADAGGVVVADNAAHTKLDYFEATTDSFGGNSGSGIYNTDGLVVGILVRGSTDYVFDSYSECYKVRVVSCIASDCSDLTSAEGISYAVTAVNAAPECLTDSDCVDSLAGSYCDLACDGAVCCTGFCSSYSRPIDYPSTDCDAYINDYVIPEPTASCGAIPIADDDGAGLAAGALVAIVIAALVVVGVIVFLIVRSQRRRPSAGLLGSQVSSGGGGGGVGGSAYVPPVVPLNRTVDVIIPANVVPGQSIQVQAPDGQNLQFLVPQGVTTGQSVTLQY